MMKEMSHARFARFAGYAEKSRYCSNRNYETVLFLIYSSAFGTVDAF